MSSDGMSSEHNLRGELEAAPVVQSVGDFSKSRRTQVRAGRRELRRV
jgi:hypothetical protein